MFFECFSLLFQGFRGSVGIQNPCYFGGFPCLFQQKNKEGKDRGGAFTELRAAVLIWERELRNENSAQSFSDRSFSKSLRVVDVRTFGSRISAPKCLFFQDFERPDRSFGPGYPREWPPDVRGMSGPKTSSLG